MNKLPRIYVEHFNIPVGDISLLRFPHDSYNHNKVKELRFKYRLNSIIKNKVSDFDQALELARWVSTRWDHKGIPAKMKKWDSLSILDAAKKGKSFSCAEFASVFTQVCHAVGIPARRLSARTKRPDLGDSGHGHVTAEYWDNQLQKWVWIDPQIHAYGLVNGNPASYFEMHTAIKPQIKFSSRTKDYIDGNGSSLKGLRDFVKRYSGSIGYGHSQDRGFLFKRQKDENYSLLIKGSPFLTFQGFPIKSAKLISHDEFYYSLNQLQIQINTGPLDQDIQFKDLEDYKENRGKFFAKSKIELNFHHNMPWFKHVELIVNGKSRIVKTSSVSIKLKKGKNKIIATPVNFAGRKGNVSEITLSFDNKYPNVKSYW